MELITNSAEETKKIGELLGQETQRGVVIALIGDLGSGKTTFLQGFAKGLGVKDKIISPTFILMRKYKVWGKKELEYFCHFDFYRINAGRDVASLDFEKFIHNKNNVVAVEWAERVDDILPSEKIVINFEYLNDSKRKITIAY